MADPDHLRPPDLDPDGPASDGPLDPQRPGGSAPPPPGGPPMSYVFLDRHRPLLETGEYTVSAELSVEGAHESRHAKFWVGGERYALPPAAIHAAYPPPGTQGAPARTLPHVALRRDTLPWERSADGRGTPWLALLVLSGTEVETRRLKTMSLRDYRAALQPPPSIEAGETDEAQVQVLELDDALVAQLPTPDELAALTHVRGSPTAAGTLADGVAVVLSKRAPGPGRNEVHLVSVEQRWATGAFARGPVVSLYRWTFYAEADAPSTATLERLFAGLASGWLRVPGGPAHPAEAFLARGRVPLPHRARSGEEGTSWYSGPLVPGAARDDRAMVQLPAGEADALLWYHAEIDMLDVTYAAAWELGRLLALEHREVAAALAGWRRAQVLARRRADAGDEARYGHLPSVQRLRARPVEVPAVLRDWVRGLWALEGVPFKYLVPDERMLPVESIRFFAASAPWIEALVHGALSLARFGEPTAGGSAAAAAPGSPYRASDQAVAALVAATRPSGELTGFLLRSEIVSGWPGLEAVVLDASGAELRSVEPRALSPSITLRLYEGRATTVVLRQHRGTLHHELPAGETVAFSGSSAALAVRLLAPSRALQLDVGWDG